MRPGVPVAPRASSARRMCRASRITGGPLAVPCCTAKSRAHVRIRDGSTTSQPMPSRRRPLHSSRGSDARSTPAGAARSISARRTRSARSIGPSALAERRGRRAAAAPPSQRRPPLWLRRPWLWRQQPPRRGCRRRPPRPVPAQREAVELEVARVDAAGGVVAAGRAGAAEAGGGCGGRCGGRRRGARSSVVWLFRRLLLRQASGGALLCFLLLGRPGRFELCDRRHQRRRRRRRRRRRPTSCASCHL